MDVLATIQKAIALFDEAEELFNKVKPALQSATAPAPTTLAEARERLNASMDRARAAGQSLDAAIAARLGE